MRYLPGGGGSTFWENKNIYGSGHFSGSGADDHQLILLYGLICKGMFVFHQIKLIFPIYRWILIVFFYIICTDKLCSIQDEDNNEVTVAPFGNFRLYSAFSAEGQCGMENLELFPHSQGTGTAYIR